MGRTAVLHYSQEESLPSISHVQPAKEAIRSRRRESVLLWTIAVVFGLLMMALLAAMICSEITIHRGQESAVGQVDVPAATAYVQIR